MGIRGAVGGLILAGLLGIMGGCGGPSTPSNGAPPEKPTPLEKKKDDANPSKPPKADPG
jgi:hypothetical protein